MTSFVVETNRLGAVNNTDFDAELRKLGYLGTQLGVRERTCGRGESQCPPLPVPVVNLQTGPAVLPKGLTSSIRQ